MGSKGVIVHYFGSVVLLFPGPRVSCRALPTDLLVKMPEKAKTTYQKNFGLCGLRKLAIELLFESEIVQEKNNQIVFNKHYNLR